MGKKLWEKAGQIQAPEVETPVPTTAADAKPKTAPGSMLRFMAEQSEVMEEAEKLRESLKSFEGTEPVRLLDPKEVGPSRWANRHPHAFQDADYQTLKAEIQGAGGNIQPIEVRPRKGGVGRSNPPYEIVYGHRRHRACLDLGIPVRALISEVSDQTLFEHMERENRQRKDLSAWEQGMMYARALDEGLYASNRQLAAAVDRDLGDVGKALALARLPAAVVAAFASPLELQFRWAKPLTDALQKDPDAVLACAKKLTQHTPRLNSKQVLAHLTGASQGVGPSNPPLVTTKTVTAGVVTLTFPSATEFRCSLKTAPLDAGQREALARWVAEFFRESGKGAKA